MTQKIIGVAGFKNAGKTTLVERLVRALAGRGYRIATVKHAHHSFDIDHEGRDSFRHRAAGASEVAVISRQRWAIIHESREEEEPSFEMILAKLSPCDLVVVKGYKHGTHLKISVLDLALPEIIFVTEYEAQRVRFPELGVTVHAVPHGAIALNLLDPVSYTENGVRNILLLHGMIPGMDDIARYEPGTEEIAESLLDTAFDYIALGHFHIWEHPRSNAWYSGSTERTGWGDEPASPGFLMEEPALFGRDARLAWQLLKLVPEWTAVNAEAAVAPELAAVIDAETGGACVLIEELYYELLEPVREYSHPDVRRFTMDDLALVESARQVRSFARLPLHLHLARLLTRDEPVPDRQREDQGAAEHDESRARQSQAAEGVDRQGGGGDEFGESLEAERSRMRVVRRLVDRRQRGEIGADAFGMREFGGVVAGHADPVPGRQRPPVERGGDTRGQVHAVEAEDLARVEDEIDVRQRAHGAERLVDVPHLDDRRVLVLRHWQVSVVRT